MSGAIYDPSVDVIDTFFQVTPLTGSVFQITGTVESSFTGAINIANWPSVQTVTGNITATSIPQTSSLSTVYKITASTTNITVFSSNSNRKGASFYKQGSGVAYLLLGTGSASSDTFTVKLSADTLYEMPYNYNGPAQMVFSTTPPGSFVTVTEFV